MLSAANDRAAERPTRRTFVLGMSVGHGRLKLVALLNENAMQVISAFLIFVLGYLTLLVSIIVCFAIGSFICEGATMAKSCLVRSALYENWTASGSRVESDVTSGFGSGGRGFTAAALRPQRISAGSPLSESTARRQGGTHRSATDG